MSVISNISVILVSYNTTDVIFDAIESAINMRGVFEVIVVNNGNPEDTLDKLRKLDASKSIKLIDGYGNIGFSKGCNIGAASASGEYCLFMNPDCYTKDHDFAVKLLKPLVSNSKYWFSTSLILNSDDTIQKTCRRNLMTPLNAISESFGLKRLGFEPINRDIVEIKFLPELSEIAAFSGALFFCSKDKYNEVGRLSEEYFLHVEDMDLCMKIHRAGGKICFVKDAIIYHKLSTSITTNKFLEYHKARGFIIYLCKFYSWCNYPVLHQLLKIAIWARYYLKTITRLS